MPDAALASAILQPIAGRGPAVPEGVSDGIVTSGTCQLRYSTPNNRTVRALKFLFGNYSISNSGVLEVDGANAFRLKAAIVYAGAVIPLWFAGRRDVTLQPGDTVQGEMHPRGREISGGFFLRTYCEVSSAGQTFPLVVDPVTLAALGEGNNYGAPGADLTDPGAGAPPALAGAFYPAHGVLGEFVDGIGGGCVALVGDSVFRGASGNVDTAGNSAMVPRWLAQRVPYLNLGRNGDQAASAVWPVNYRRRLDLLARVAVSDIIINYGINDLVLGGATDAVLRRDVLALVRQLQAIKPFARFWICTMTPHSSSTDGWATVGNQTAGSELAHRAANNDWRRTVPPPFVGCLEIADPVESGRNDGRWKAAHTSDGIHPNSTGCVAGIASLPDPLALYSRAA